jgi:iron complex outermembrane receptor protein
MQLKRVVKTILFGSASFLAVPGLAMAQSGAATSDGQAPGVEAVVVTGSRVISDAANSPTPLTVVSTEQLLATTPTDIPDALNKLPVFQGSAQPRTAGNGGTASGINVLNLRNFGAQRTLILVDGHRAPPSNSDGTVDIDTLPQMLMTRVDVVTGGASAVYGSDAVTGVVNFILDKQFNGVKFDVNSGISNYGDGASYKLGLAAGTDLFGGRGHIEGSLEHLNQDGVRESARPYGPKYFSQAGSGTVSNPYTTIENTRVSTHTFGGLISCAGCSNLNGQQFVGNGVVGPFTPGTPTGTANVQSGGDGAYDPFGSATTAFRTNDAFGRFSYNIDNDTTFYVQGTAAEGYADGVWYPSLLNPGDAQPNQFFTNNPYLPAGIQQQLNPNNTPGKKFQLTEYITDQGNRGAVQTRNVDRNLGVTAGLDGTLFGKFAWDAFYTHGESRQAVSNVNNTDFQKLYAAEDAVSTPGGQTACYAATQAVTAGAYGNCVPLNPFGPTAVTPSAYNYFTSTTQYRMTNIMDDFGGSVSGTVIDDWAGPIKASVSAEMRFNDYSVDSNASPTATVDCTGLRLCNSATPRWAQNTVSNVHASDNVWEFAGELGVPLLKDLPFVQSLDLNLAGRYTDYSTSGSAQTWKIGLDYHVNDDIRFRGTTSVDIRAPTLNDLYSPVQNSVTGFTDIHTNTNGSLFISSTGNPNLVPEVARTYTAGVVLTPTEVPGLTVSLDYYRINLKNAIGSISATNTQIQNICEQSNGASPYCVLFNRPLPFGDHSSENYPSNILSENLNTASSNVEGFDFETDYQFDMADVVSSWDGSWSVRLLANYQPVNNTQQFTDAADTRAIYAHGHVTGFLNYDVGNWSLGLQDRWISGFSQASEPTIIFTQPHVNSVNYIDLNVERKFKVDDAELSAYLTVQNIFNTLSPVYSNTSGAPGIYYPVPDGEDVMGRYFTIGVRASL